MKRWNKTTIEIRHELMVYKILTCGLRKASNLQMVAHVLLKIREVWTTCWLRTPKLQGYAYFWSIFTRCPIWSFLMLCMFYLWKHGKQHRCMCLHKTIWENMNLLSWLLFICLQFATKLICLQYWIRTRFLIWTIGLGIS